LKLTVREFTENDIEKIDKFIKVVYTLGVIGRTFHEKPNPEN